MTFFRRAGDGNKKWRTVIWRSSALIAAVLVIWPVKYQSTRAMALLFIGGAVVGVLMRCWPMPKLKWFLPAIILLLSLFLLLPGRALNSERLRKRCVSVLESFVELLRWRCLD